MRQRYFSPENLTQSQQYSFSAISKPQKRLRSNGSVTNLASHPISHLFEENTEIIGNYKIDLRKQIGSGYSSKVYKAISLKDSQQVAVKVLNIKKFSPSSLQMLQAEIRILRKMNHPNILKCYQVYRTSSHCYIVTQYCPKGDLQTYMTRKGIFTEKEAIQIISQVSQGVKHLFKNGIIHRDLKPANILQGTSNWKIADFGFAIQSQNEITTKHNVGTPLYMPPQALIKNLYSPESDIFAVGIMLFQMLVGVTPWECSSQKELIRRLTSLPLKIPQKIKLSMSTRHLIEKLCNVQMSQRTSKQQFLALNFNNFSTLDIMNLTYSKKTTSTQVPSKKNIDNKKSQSKSKTKKKILLKVTSKDTIIKASSISNNSSLIKFKQTSKQLNLTRSKKSTSIIKGTSQYGVVNKLKSQPKNIKKTKQSSLLKQKKSISKKIKTQTNLEYKNNLDSTTLSTSIYQSSDVKSQSKDHKSYKCLKVEMKFQQKLLAINHRIIINQLDYCRFLYYLVRNLHHLNVKEVSRQKTGLIIFRHLIRLIKHLTDTKTNCFGLMNWQAFKNTPKFSNTHHTIVQYAKRYEKQYLAHIKNIQISVIRDISQKINQLNNTEPFSINTYSKILSLIIPVVKQSKQNLSQIIQSQFAPLNKKTKANIEALSVLCKYKKLIEISTKQFQNFTYFQENSELFFLKDFNETAANAAVFFKLKEEIKFY